MYILEFTLTFSQAVFIAEDYLSIYTTSRSLTMLANENVFISVLAVIVAVGFIIAFFSPKWDDWWTLIPPLDDSSHVIMTERRHFHNCYLHVLPAYHAPSLTYQLLFQVTCHKDTTGVAIAWFSHHYCVYPVHNIAEKVASFNATPSFRKIRMSIIETLNCLKEWIQPPDKRHLPDLTASQVAQSKDIPALMP